MTGFILRACITALGLWLATRLVSGIRIDDPWTLVFAGMLLGVVTLARLTGAPVLMAVAHRSADYRHQVLEISPPVPMEGETAAVFERCVAAMDDAIRANPAEWDFWFEPDDLARLGLLPSAPQPVAQADERTGVSERLRRNRSGVITGL